MSGFQVHESPNEKIMAAVGVEAGRGRGVTGVAVPHCGTRWFRMCEPVQVLRLLPASLLTDVMTRTKENDGSAKPGPGLPERRHKSWTRTD
jgi:hypothetical protein